MFPWAHFAVQSVSPPERFSTTYSSDYNEPWLKPRSEARPGFTGSLQSETLPVLLQHLCIKSIDTNGSAVGSQPPSGCPFLAFSTSDGSLPPSFSGEIRKAGSEDGEVARQEPGAGTGLSFGLRGEGLWLDVCGHKAVNLLGQQEVEPKRNNDVHYKEGVILLISCKGPIGCEELLHFFHTEPSVPHLLPLPLASSPFIRLSQNTDAGTGENGLSLPGPAGELQSSAFLQPSPGLCSRPGWLTEYQASYARQVQDGGDRRSAGGTVTFSPLFLSTPAGPA